MCVCVWAPLCHFSDVRYYNLPCYQYQVTNLDDYRYNIVYCICACKCELVCMWQIRNKRPVCGHMMAGDSINNVTQPQSELWNWNIMLWRRKFIPTVWSLSVCVCCVWERMNICAFVDALGISVRPAQIVSVLSAATNHFSADKKGHVLTDGKSPLNIKEQGKQRFPAYKVHDDFFSFYRFPSIYLNRTG